MAHSQRLYFDDPWLHRFEAEVVGHGRFGQRDSVVLDRTAFYPEAGGQMADRGQLGAAAVSDVQQDADGTIHHLLDAALPAVGSRLVGSVDRARRRIHMALHTGQHILSRALLDEVGAQTLSSRLGETGCTIDLDRETIDEAAIARAEALANAVVDDDVLVEAFFPDAAELAALSLRRESKVKDGLRVVKVGDFDVSPCGGTHCTRSGQVGLVFVSGVERHKQRVRLSFSAGGRARAELASAHRGLSQLAEHFSCGLDDVQLAVDKLRRESSDARAELQQTRVRLAEAMTASMLARGEVGEPVIASLDSIAPAMLREVAKAVAAGGRVALLASAADGGVQVVASRPSGHDFDCKAFIAAVCAAAEGRGGGRPDHAEARLTADVAWPQLAAAALRR